MQTEPASTVTDNTRHGAPGPSRPSLARQPPKPSVRLLTTKQRHDLQLPLEKPAAENRPPTSMDDSETDDGYEKQLSRKAKRRRFSSQQQQRETADGNERSSQPAVAMRNPQRRRPPRAQPLVVGMSTRKTDINAAKAFKQVYCIDNASKATTESQLANFVTKLGVRVFSCYEVEPRQSVYERENDIAADHLTFRLCINRADKERLLNAKTWPADLLISTWHFKNRNKDSG